MFSVMASQAQKGKTMLRVKYLLPAISMSFMARAIQGSINKVVNALMRKDADVVLRPKFERRTETPASSRI